MRRTGILRKTPLKAKRDKPRRERFEHLKDEAYRAWIRNLPCILSDRKDEEGNPHQCWSQIEACHVRTKATGTGDRCNLFPACGLGHRIQHVVGIKSFQRRFKLSSLEQIAIQLDALYESEQGRTI